MRNRIRTRYLNVRAALTTLATAVVVVGAFLTPAAAAAVEKGEYCAVILSKEPDANGVSKVLSKECSTVSAADAHRKAGVEGGVSIAADTKLASLYRHQDYGDLMVDLYGQYGPCDHEGYTFILDGKYAYALSSVIGHNSCTWSKLTSEGGYYEYHALPVRNIGALNDNTKVIHLWRG
ncbi:hypothetical protein [Nonomuraea sp. NPDC049400]|uniref:hypothetical protein n=1 Tax=Nonomuraea sp. NPDC049400 TaxID=3364352 RepID=UPI0037A5899F